MTVARALARDINLESVITSLGQTAVHFAMKLTASIFILVAGLWLAGRISRSVKRGMERRHLDPSLQSFIGSFVSIVLRIIAIVISLTTVGVQMTSIVAVLGAGALAIGMALSGTMQNFAGGIIILFLKPFKVGDTILTATGKTGIVKKIMIFTTELRTFDNQVIFLPNGALSNGEITNLSGGSLRRTDLAVGISYGSRIPVARRAILDILARDPRIADTPAPSVFVRELGDSAVILTVRFWSKYGDMADASADTLEQIYSELTKKRVDFPFPQMDVHLTKYSVTIYILKQQKGRNMKKISVFVIAGMMASSASFAGFIADAPVAPQNADVIVSVAQVKKMRDDTPVIVQGNIIQRMGDEKYLFRDGTDSVIVEIDDEDWGGVDVRATDTVKLYGEVDASMFKTEIDVDRIEKIEK